MEKEISSGAMLGIVLIALAAIIGIGFGVFAIAKGVANNGVTNVQEKLENVSESEFTDFDQTIVTGSQVKTAYDNFVGKNVAILIATQALIDKTSEIETCTEETAESFGSNDLTLGTMAKALKKENGFNNSKMYTDPDAKDILAKLVPCAGVDGCEKGYTVNKSSGDAVNVVFMNYNALLGSISADGKTISQANLGFDTTHFVVTSSFKSLNGQVQFNNLAGNLSKSGMIEYLPSSARFQAYLVKDSSGSIMGCAFNQLGK